MSGHALVGFRAMPRPFLLFHSFPCDYFEKASASPSMPAICQISLLSRASYRWMTDQRPPARPQSSNACLIKIAASAFMMLAFAGNACALEPAAEESALAQSEAISPQMSLDEAVQAFERNYRAPDSADHYRALTSISAQHLMKNLSVLSAKLLSASKHSQERISLPPYVLPVYMSRQKRENWSRILPSGVRPPEVSYQTFAVTLNGEAFVIAPAHGARGDKRYYTTPKSDTAVRLATEEEAKHAIPLDRRPSELPGKLVFLEGKLPTGENVRLKSAVVRGLEPLQTLLPDPKNSFHNWKRGVEVDYGRIEIFVLPPEWSYLNRLKLHRATGSSGAPAIENTPEGDVIIGHFIGHHTTKVGKTNITLGILEDYEAIRSVVEKFASLPRKETTHGSGKRPHP